MLLMITGESKSSKRQVLRISVKRQVLRIFLNQLISCHIYCINPKEPVTD